MQISQPTAMELDRALHTAMRRNPDATQRRLEWLTDHYIEMRCAGASKTDIVREMKKQGLYSRTTNVNDVTIDYLIRDFEL